MSRRRVIIGAVGLAVLVGLALAGYHILGSSNQGTISQGSTEQARKWIPAFRTLDGTYISLQYKGSYMLSRLPATDDDLEIYRLSDDTTYARQIDISVSKLPSGSLQTDSAWLLRKSKPDQYTEQHLQFPAGTVDLWTKQDGTEETAFLVNGTRVAAIAFAQQAGSVSMDPEMQAMLKSFVWR